MYSDMKKLVYAMLALAVALSVSVSCGEKISSHGSGSSFVFTDDSDNITATSARLHAHYVGTEIEGDNVGVICDKDGKLNASKSPRVSSVPGEDGKFYVTFFDLTPDTVYEYMAYAKADGKEYYGKKKSFRTQGIPVTSVTVTAPATILYMEDNKPMELTVKVLPENANQQVTWTSSNDKIATVSNTGVVTGKSGGEVTITATSVQTSSKSGSCKISIKSVPPPGAIDLALPSGRYWRNCNLGADNSSQKGDYYAWAEISSKSSFTEDNYKWKPDGHITYEKYYGSYSSSYVDVDHLTYLRQADYEDDAARYKLGGTWRIPSMADWEELRNNCTLTKVSGGIKFTAKNKDRRGQYNEIFLPFGGYKSESTMQYPESGFYGENQGFYWGDEVRYRWYNGSPDNFSALMLYIKFGTECNAGIEWKLRYYGAMIRPVCD